MHLRTALKAPSRIPSLALAILLATAWQAAACSVCYGEPDSPTTRGLTWAIVLLGMVVVGVLAGIVSFFVAANKNAALGDNEPSQQE